MAIVIYAAAVETNEKNLIVMFVNKFVSKFLFAL